MCSWSDYLFLFRKYNPLAWFEFIYIRRLSSHHLLWIITIAETLHVVCVGTNGSSKVVWNFLIMGQFECSANWVWQIIELLRLLTTVHYDEILFLLLSFILCCLVLYYDYLAFSKYFCSELMGIVEAYGYFSGYRHLC